MKKIKIGLYGSNGHQIHRALVDHPMGECVAVAEFDRELLPEALKSAEQVRYYDTLETMLADESIELVSLCSPRRADQAAQAIRCMEAGKHVYAEKPCALTEADLDAILAAAQRTGKVFHEMAGTAFEQPYLALRGLVQQGVLGTVVQVLAQKSYPYHNRRPQDEAVDGGQLLQVGVHALRFIEHVACLKVTEIYAIETQVGNPAPGDLRMATSMMMRLENGGVAGVTCNYLNPPTFGAWGNESLRIFGTQGFVEAVDGGTKTRLVLNEEDRGPLTITEPGLPYLDLLLAALLGQGTMPLSLEDEIHPTRMLIRAKVDATARGVWRRD
ncbi:MAG: Gfo/Idh/MocA family oxidoreductase [Anaerolineae bacterium]|nr:Gfo/Idh/MocA family oxidoreductase [Anaerolineae bacterium]